MNVLFQILQKVNNKIHNEKLLAIENFKITKYYNSHFKTQIRYDCKSVTTEF